MNLDRRRFLGLLGALSAPRVALALDSAVTVVRFPYLQRTRSDRVAIMWTTLQQGEGKVQYSADLKTFNFASAKSRTFYPDETGLPYTFVQYEAALTGLQPKTLYSYRVTVDGQTVQDSQFATAGPGAFDFMVFGDSGQYTQGQVDITARIVLERPSFVLHLGDIAYNEGTFEQFQVRYFDYYRSIMNRVPFFATPGNHEYTLGDATPYVAVHGLPSETVPAADRGRYYSFDWGNAHFVSLDTNTPLVRAVEEDGQMLRWLEHDLNSTRQFWRIVFFHHPPYAVGPNETNILSALARENIVPILEAYGVHLVFSGHEHSYQRSQSIRGGAISNPGQGTVYITSGGGGGGLYPVWDSPLVSASKSDFHYLRVGVTDSELVLKAINGSGTILDTFSLKPTPVVESFKQIPAITFTPARSVGAIVRIVGRNLASDERYISGSQLPLQLGGTQVTVNDQPIQLIYTSTNEIYGRIPFDIPAVASLKITTRMGTTEIPI
jgi:hypothetical protein